MRKASILFFMLLLLTSTVYSQRKSKLNTNGKGVLLGYVGYNRSAYNPTAISILSSNYNFSIQNARMSDNPDFVSLGSYLNSGGTPQMNAFLGYFVAHKWSLGIGWSRYNLFWSADPNTTMAGSFAPGVHGELSGAYQGVPFAPDSESFNYVQKKGVNVFNLKLSRVDQHKKSRDASFALQTVISISGGPIFSNTTYTFNGVVNSEVSGFSGYSGSVQGALRLVFFQHFFLQMGFSTGFLIQNDIALNSTKTTTAQHRNGFFSPEVALGFAVFARPTNGCGTCPQW